MADFEDRSGIVSCTTSWGRWYQTVADVNIEVDLIQGTKGSEVKVEILPRRISCSVRGSSIFKGALFDTIIEDESTWTLEDRRLLRILLIKVRKDDYWVSLLENQYRPDPFTLQQMRQKLDLERYQLEHPGFDFSGARLDKNYDMAGLDNTDNIDNIDQLGAAALPSLSIGDNKTDDEKLLECRPVATDDMKTEPSSTAAAHPLTVALPTTAAHPSTAVSASTAVHPATASLHPTAGQAASTVSPLLSTAGPLLSTAALVTDDMKVEPCEAVTAVESVVTDDMKNEQNESLETDEEKSAQ